MSPSRQPGLPHPRLPLPEGKEDLHAFHRWLGEAIPMVGALGISDVSHANDALTGTWRWRLTSTIKAPALAVPGSTSHPARMVLGDPVAAPAGRAQDVVVAEASQRFVAPVTGDYRLICTPSSSDGPATLAERLHERGKGSIALSQQLYCGDTLCLEASSRYAVLPSP